MDLQFCFQNLHLKPVMFNPNVAKRDTFWRTGGPEKLAQSKATSVSHTTSYPSYKYDGSRSPHSYIGTHDYNTIKTPSPSYSDSEPDNNNVNPQHSPSPSPISRKPTQDSLDDYPPFTFTDPTKDFHLSQFEGPQCLYDKLLDYERKRWNAWKIKAEVRYSILFFSSLKTKVFFLDGRSALHSRTPAPHSSGCDTFSQASHVCIACSSTCNTTLS